MFIILEYFLEYRRRQTLQSYELIVMLLAFCSIITELSTVIWCFVYFLDLCTNVGEMLYFVNDSIITFFPKSAIWFTAWLCFVYCVKIVKVNWRFFLRLKQRISLLVKFMIAWTLLLCFSISIPVSFQIEFTPNITQMCRLYYKSSGKIESRLIYSSFLSMSTSFLPLVLMLFSSLGIVIFLCRHSRNMDKNINSSSSSRNEAHVSVAIMLLCLIALFVACAGTALSANLQIATGEFDLAVAIILTQLIYSAGSPVILITGTVKLRNGFEKRFCPKR
ncbi:taste receptor type 2 member 40-like [Latimeria chalumnae]|uniref:taste receptor type 2 member 40-like n=1 Tax=Latimeria chalumnae TaxID=7897 RepID=UPI0006D8F849|nr:PREDICTED: taste receptor type 2 member 40-like [Latimeria chalumnae]|eukprot:XP_006013885.2 PREDICTED: taste receptor type 2 member 40-like [Latimeria chalumnae]